MTPAVGAGGLAGLALLDRTYERQFAAFSRTASVERAVADFEARAGGVTSAADLVADRRLLEVALGAFGLEDEIDKRALVRRVLEEGGTSRDSLAVKMVDPAWRQLSSTLGFDLGGLLWDASVRSEIVERYRTRAFEKAVGDEDVSLRLALHFRREIGEVAREPGVERSGWFRVVGSEPLRRVVFGALGLPESFGALDIDEQARRLEARAEAAFGASSPAVFRDPAMVETAVRRFLANAALQGGPAATTPGATALSILGSGLGQGATAGLFGSLL